MFMFSVVIGYAPEYSVIYIIETPACVKGFTHYADDLGYDESRNDITIINEIGCFAEHQWKQTTLRYLGYNNITLSEFKKDPSIFPKEIQREALRKLIDTTKFELRSYKYYIGTVIDDVEITESGLIAACHLGGIKSVRKYLLSRGQYLLIDGFRINIKHSKKQVKFNSHDIFGTYISDYIEKFNFYSL